jgi:hypothetical protein
MLEVVMTHEILEKEVKNKFPFICQLLGQETIKNHIQKIPLNFDKEFLDCENFTKIIVDMIATVCGRLHYNTVADIEKSLQFLNKNGYGNQLQCFKKKLFDNEAYEPTLYEIAMAAILSNIFDAGTMEFEKNIPNTCKNTDIYGKYQTSPIRLEVKRIEESYTSHDINEKKIVESADIPSGFRVTLNCYLLPQDGKRFKKWIEDFWRTINSDKTTFSKHGDFEFEGVTYYREWEDYVPLKDDQHNFVQRICFYNECQAFRIVSEPSSTQSMIGESAREDLNSQNSQNLLNVHSGDNSSRKVATSKKFYDEIQLKLKQCENNCINIIVIGNPDPVNDSDLKNAMSGQPFGEFSIYSNGAFSPNGRLCRYPNGPFIPLEEIPADRREDMSNIIEEFSKLSAVIGIRVGYSGSHPRYVEIIENPNAEKKIPHCFKKAIEESYDDFIKQL